MKNKFQNSSDFLFFSFSLALFPLLLLLALTFIAPYAVWTEDSAGVKGTATPDEILIVNSDPTDPAVPLDLSLTVRLFLRQRFLEITVRVGKHPAYPPKLFFSKDVKVEIRLPRGLEAQKGSLSWMGDLRGSGIREFQATVRVERDIEGAVDVSAIGHAEGGRIDADTERFYVLARGNTIKIGLEPFTKPSPYQPGTGQQKQ